MLKNMKGKTLISAAAILAGFVLVFAVVAAVQAQFQFQPSSGNQPLIQSNATNSGSLNATSSTNGLNTTSTQTMIAAQGTGLYVWVKQASCINTSTTATVAKLLDGATVRAYISCPPSGAAGGIQLFDPPMRWTVNTAVGMANTVAEGSTYFWVQGYRTNQ